jgi:predicted transcriptional regulator
MIIRIQPIKEQAMERYPMSIMVRVSEEDKVNIDELAKKEERTTTNMARVLIREALRQREQANNINNGNTEE